MMNIKARLGRALYEAGIFEEADVVLADAASGDDERPARSAALDRTWLNLMLYPERVILDQVQAETEGSIAVFAKLDDHEGLARAWLLLNEVHAQRCHLVAATESAERAIEHARQANDARDEGYAVSFLAMALACGPVPAAVALDSWPS
jgi:uncharacterized protein YyaL (SSP411 family)